MIMPILDRSEGLCSITHNFDLNQTAKVKGMKKNLKIIIHENEGQARPAARRNLTTSITKNTLNRE